MTYNKSQIMKRAWSNFKTGKSRTFSQALKLAWKEAKTGLEAVTSNELNIGDTVEIEYGDYNNFVKCTITSITEDSSYSVVNAVCGRVNVEFCMKPNGIIFKCVIENTMMMAA